MANEKNLKPFKKGVSGNPGGRPKWKQITEILKSEKNQEKLEEMRINHKNITRLMVKNNSICTNCESNPSLMICVNNSFRKLNEALRHQVQISD